MFHRQLSNFQGLAKILTNNSLLVAEYFASSRTSVGSRIRLLVVRQSHLKHGYCSWIPTPLLSGRLHDGALRGVSAGCIPTTNGGGELVKQLGAQGFGEDVRELFGC